MAITNFTARQATVAYATGAITWDTSTEASDESMTANIAELKNVSVTPPEVQPEAELLLGSYAQTIGANARTAGTATGIVAGTFQNQAMYIKNAPTWKITGTLVLTGDEQFADILGLDSGTAINSLAHRYSVGNLNTSTGAWAANYLGTIRVFCNNGSEEFNSVLTNTFVKLGDIKPTGTDGHWEREVELTCLQKDGVFEWLD